MRNFKKYRRRRSVAGAVAIVLWMCLPALAGESNIPLHILASIMSADLAAATFFTYLAGGYHGR